jgi:hypothetical protein
VQALALDRLEAAGTARVDLADMAEERTLGAPFGSLS